MLSALYAGAAAWRRRWYARRPAARRRLSRPVVSVGALAAGGSGKTPVAALVAELLRDAGERPAVLSRGYGRRMRACRVVVARDPDGVRAGVETAGDEPRMLAERLDGVSVVVARDRYLAGRLAETRLGATVHVLDDGFQHLRLARDVELVLLRADDLEQPTFPAGRLRERPSTARLAHALVVEAADAETAAAVAGRLRAATWFALRRSLGVPRPVAGSRPVAGTAAVGAGAPRAAACAPRRNPRPEDEGILVRAPDAGPPGAGGGAPAAPPEEARAASPAPLLGQPASSVRAVPPEEARAAGPVLAVAGVAAPERFRAALGQAGFRIAGALAFADHHRFTPADVRRIAARTAACGARLVLTTEKDAVRLAPLAPFDFALAAVPLRVAVEPADRFRAWLIERVAAAAGERR